MLVAIASSRLIAMPPIPLLRRPTLSPVSSARVAMLRVATLRPLRFDAVSCSLLHRPSMISRSLLGGAEILETSIAFAEAGGRATSHRSTQRSPGRSRQRSLRPAELSNWDSLHSRQAGAAGNLRA